MACKGCTNCSVKCGNELENIEKAKEKMKSHGGNPKRICMNQATYEAISGNRLELCDLCVTIDDRIQDKSYLVLGD